MLYVSVELNDPCGCRVLYELTLCFNDFVGSVAWGSLFLDFSVFEEYDD